jgi:hypothetical protein
MLATQQGDIVWFQSAAHGGETTGGGRMRFSRLLLIVAVTLPMGACLTAAEQAQEIAASDDAACRDAGTKPGTPAYAKCREDMSNRRNMSQMAARIGMQNQIWSQQEMMRQDMFRH